MRIDFQGDTQIQSVDGFTVSVLGLYALAQLLIAGVIEYQREEISVLIEQNRESLRLLPMPKGAD